MYNTYGDGQSVTVQKEAGDPPSVVFKVAACGDAKIQLCKTVDGQEQCVFEVEIGKSD